MSRESIKEYWDAIEKIVIDDNRPVKTNIYPPRHLRNKFKCKKAYRLAVWTITKKL